MSSVTCNLSRRGFLKAGSGLVLGLHLSGFGPLPELDEFAVATELTGRGSSHPLNAWLRISPDGQATVRIGAVEMGQGVYTSLPMLLAEELELPFEQVRVEASPTDKAYYRPSPTLPIPVLMTGGSESVRGHWLQLRQAGAEARQMLISAAAKRWKVAARNCHAQGGSVHCRERRASYGELAESAAELHPPHRVRLKEPEAFTLLGSSPQRIDLPEKVCGAAVFGIDVQREGMVNATLRACPHHGGELVSFDPSEALKVSGVRDIFAIDHAVAVVADYYWQASKAAKLLNITWNEGRGKGLDNAAIRGKLEGALEEARVVHRRGTAPRDLELSVNYYSPHLEHAPIEPLNATVHVQPEQVEVWAPTQVQAEVQKQASRLTGIPRERCFVHPTYLGGGFGRRTLVDFTGAAIQIAMRVNRPVKMLWSREECFARGQYRPATACRLSATLGPDGFPTDYEARIASQNIFDGRVPDFLLELKFITATVHEGLDTPYAIQREAVRYQRIQLPIPIGWWRSVHASHNGFYRESFIDELAHRGGHDPIQYRRRLLRNSPRHLQCFELALAKSPPLPAGQHRGVALFKSYGSIVATVLDLSMRDGWPKVHRIVCAVDCGRVVHPDTVHAQLMGASLMGLSAALYEEMSFEDGRAVQSNFHQYKLLGMAEAPQVDSYIVPSEEDPGGIGEVALPPLAAALGNALFSATGVRYRQLPLGKQLKQS